MVTRKKAIQNLQNYLNQDLYILAGKHEITVNKNGKQNKGWERQILEKLAGLDSNNIQSSVD